MSEKQTKVTIEPEDWKKIIGYIMGIPVPFGELEKAMEIKSIFARVVWIDVKMEDEQG